MAWTMYAQAASIAQVYMGNDSVTGISSYLCLLSASWVLAPQILARSLYGTERLVKAADDK